MNVSIVIPVYNEALELDACLQAISKQTVMPFEVIVVDNNSTDNTRDIAAAYSFVKLTTEPKQGVVHARTTGFNAARGEIIARIDADTVIPDDWVAYLQTLFGTTKLDAVSGVAEYYNLSGAGFFNRADARLRRYLAKRLEGAMYLWGANMAIRKIAWQQIAHEVCMQNGIHEDYDLGLHLQGHGLAVGFDENLKVGVSSRRIDVGYREFMRYTLASPRTYAYHNAGHQMLWYGVSVAAAVMYLPTHIMYRGYDDRSKRFMLRKLFAERSTPPRIDPTTNVA